MRLAPQPWRSGAENEDWFRSWFDRARVDTSPDMFAIAFEYVEGASDLSDDKGVRYAGDAAFGPVLPSGEGPSENNDFHDYLGLSWKFPDRPAPVEAKPERFGSLDCSGYVRMVVGYRMGYPLLGLNEPGPGLPRRAWAILANGPGVLLTPDTGRTVTDYSKLQPGDLLIFEVDSKDPRLDHIAIYLGVDSTGYRRFISSRRKANGPTMGDIGGTSLLDDGSFFGRGLRGMRRI